MGELMRILSGIIEEELRKELDEIIWNWKSWLGTDKKGKHTLIKENIEILISGKFWLRLNFQSTKKILIDWKFNLRFV